MTAFWQWTAPGGSRPPEWIGGCLDLPGETVKTNAKRTVRLVSAPDGGRYYVKHEIPRVFWARLFPALSALKAAREFRAAGKLAEKRIPCVRYAAFGRKGAETLLVSEAFEHAVSAKEYWFSMAIFSEAKRHAFLCVLKDLIGRLFAAGVRHDDFHAGNLLVRPSADPAVPPELTLVDPAGIRFGKKASAFELAHIYADFLPDMREDEACGLLAGLSDRPDFLAAEIRDSLCRLIEREWPKRRVQILSGNSKFSRTATRGGRTFEIASTEWFAPRELPDEPESWPHETFPAGVAEERWLMYFRARLEGKNFSPRCFFREKSGQDQTLYYEPDR